MSESSSFDLVAFIPLLRERIYTQNQFARQFIVSWVSVYTPPGNYKHKTFFFNSFPFHSGQMSSAVSSVCVLW